ncbi:hypothetical protein GDO81_008275 [Engystomops pustulosus]|uniref:Uncharacterized protein n=1 Tax=Engystomops pustulosus TaxID=76066 RepID=A0AAV7CDQ2_ENGPU|nr:hypothetical protein GDO81_008275 [Engystomops pustulosus]
MEINNKGILEVTDHFFTTCCKQIMILGGGRFPLKGSPAAGPSYLSVQRHVINILSLQMKKASGIIKQLLNI